MSFRFTLRNTLALWLIRRGLRMLSKPYWAIGAIALPTPLTDALVALTFVTGPQKDKEQSVVNSALCELLSGIASGKDMSSEHLAFGSLNPLDPESDGSPDTKSLH